MLFVKNEEGNYVAIAGCTSHSLTTSLSFTETSVKTKDDGTQRGAWTEQEADKFSWSVSASALMTFGIDDEKAQTGYSFGDLYKLYSNGEQVYVVMGLKDDTEEQEEYILPEDGSAPDGGWRPAVDVLSGGVIKPMSGKEPHLSGMGRISNLSISAEVGSKVTYDIEITGNGELSYVLPQS